MRRNRQDQFYGVDVVAIAYATNGKVIVPRSWMKEAEHRVHGLLEQGRMSFTLPALCNLNGRPGPPSVFANCGGLAESVTKELSEFLAITMEMPNLSEWQHARLFLLLSLILQELSRRMTKKYIASEGFDNFYFNYVLKTGGVPENAIGKLVEATGISSIDHKRVILFEAGDAGRVETPQRTLTMEKIPVSFGGFLLLFFFWGGGGGGKKVGFGEQNA